MFPFQRKPFARVLSASCFAIFAYIGLVGLLSSTPVFAATPAPLTPAQALGEQIFNDKNLSEPRGTACVNCHQASTGFANLNGARIGVPLGSLPKSFAPAA